MSDDQLLSLLAEADLDAVFLVRFTDGTEEELMECCVWGDPENRECLGIVVRRGERSKRAPGDAILFAFDDVADVEVRGFEHFR